MGFLRRMAVGVLLLGLQPLFAENQTFSKDFSGNYLEISEAVLQSVSDLKNGEENTLKNFEFDQDLELVKGRLDGLSVKFKYEFASPNPESEFEKKAWVDLVDVLAKVTETSDYTGTSLLTFLNNQDLFDSGLKESIRLFLKAEQLASGSMPADDQQKARSLLARYPLIERGEPYTGALFDDNGSATLIYPDSPADKAGIQIGDRIKSADADKLKRSVYSPVSLTLERNRQIKIVSLTPILYGFPKKPAMIGIGGLQNASNSAKASVFLQALIASYFRQSDTAAAFDAKPILFSSKPAEIAAYAADHGLDYIITGRITKFENSGWSTGWMGMLGSSGYAIHIEGEFNLYNSAGKLLGNASLKAENPSGAQIEDANWVSVGKKFTQASFGPWVHRLIGF